MSTTPPPNSQSSQSREIYRVDVDGLRGIAVLSVILFHIDSRLLPGGFIGVDIFFVISGYLISLHILNDIERGRFTLTEFYRRRIKRIAPAMLVVVAVTLAISQLLFRPQDAERIAESALWALGSLANVYFWLRQDTSYFAAANNEQPLLHLWSLGVEEQFYILWPLLLVAFYRASHARVFVAVILAVATVSFVLGDLLFDRDPSFVYYMLPTRAGELLVGALAAQWILRNGAARLEQVNVQRVAIVGVALLVGSLLLIAEDQVFPGWRALPPTVGTALLIVAGHYRASWPTILISWRPLVWTGLISYSAYLWHWPILAFARYAGFEIGVVTGSALFILTLLVGWLSYRFIEQPARHTHRGVIQVAIRQYVAPAGTLAVAALIAMKLDGYGPRWFSESYRAQLAEIQNSVIPAFRYDYVCQRQRIAADDVVASRCLVGSAQGGVARALLWGDSNATHYVGMLGAFARREDYVFRNVAVGSCPPIHEDPAPFVKADRVADCRASFKAIGPILDDYKVIWISANWTGYEARSQHFMDAVANTVKEMASRGKRVVLLGKAPVIDGYDRLCWEKAVSMPFLKCGSPVVPLSDEVVQINSRLRSIAAETANVVYFDANSYLCPEGACASTDESGSRIYFDSSHLTLDASWRLGEKILADGVPTQFQRTSVIF